MKRMILFGLFVANVFCGAAYGQNLNWKVGVDYFFDNTEYDKSSFIDSETMNGIWFNPQLGLTWDERHSITGGANMLVIPGWDEYKVNVTVYYQYRSPKVLFRAGAFPRDEVLSNYDTFFFKDSVNNFVPLMQGVFFQFGNERSFFNAWFDRTGYATPARHEHFFVGLSGKWSKRLFFADFQSYMFHHSNTRPAKEGEGVSENLQLQASVGVAYAKNDYLNLLFSAGTLLGYERDRRFDDRLYKPAGFTARAHAEYMGIGTENTAYFGDARMRLADTFGGDLYWGTQFLRARSYVKSEWYIRLLESDWAKVRFNCNLHFSEGNLLFQQMLTVSASVDNFTFRKKERPRYPWMKLFE